MSGIRMPDEQMQPSKADRSGIGLIGCPRGRRAGMDRISILTAPRNRVALSSPLTQIHPFPNGNGRFSGTAADLLIMHLEDKSTLGLINLVDASVTRREYIDALQAADNDALEPLLAFARS
jgi:hypothetical protein